jgi:hypothetical protein
LATKNKSLLKEMMLLGGSDESYVVGACCSESDRVDKEEEE